MGEKGVWEREEILLGFRRVHFVFQFETSQISAERLVYTLNLLLGFRRVHFVFQFEALQISAERHVYILNHRILVSKVSLGWSRVLYVF